MTENSEFSSICCWKFINRNANKYASMWAAETSWLLRTRFTSRFVAKNQTSCKNRYFDIEADLISVVSRLGVIEIFGGLGDRFDRSPLHFRFIGSSSIVKWNDANLACFYIEMKHLVGFFTSGWHIDRTPLILHQEFNEHTFMPNLILLVIFQKLLGSPRFAAFHIGNVQEATGRHR